MDLKYKSTEAKINMQNEYIDRLNKYKVNQDGRNSKVPPPPKPGELIHCLYCGEVMYPEDFSKDKIIRKKEFKWQCHYRCMQKAYQMCDLKTPGLLSERKYSQQEKYTGGPLRKTKR